MKYLINKTFAIAIMLLIIMAYNSNAEAPVLVGPADNETCAELPVNLSWNEVPTSDNYHIQVATEPGFLNIVVDDPLYTELEFEVPLDFSTDYWWRIGSVEGGNTDWSEVWMFTTAIEPPDGLIPSPGTSCVSANTHFEWNEYPNALTYDLQVATDLEFNNLVVNQAGLTNNMYDAALSNSSPYFMRVKVNLTDCSSGWSDPSDFTTTISTPVQTWPTSNITFTGLERIVAWEDTGDDFALQIDNDPDFSSPEIDVTGLTDSSYSANLTMYYTTYYWRVRAEGTSCNSDWSGAWNFTTMPAPPTGLYPFDSTNCQLTEFEFSWNPAIETEGYRFILSTDASFTDTVAFEAVADTFFLVSGLANATDYYWSVRGEDDNYTGDWAPVHYFNTINAVADLISPEDEFRGSPFTVNFEWQEMGPNTKYVIFISPDDSFSDTTHYEMDLTETMFEFTFTEFDQYYYWKVGTYTDNCIIQWSDVWRFETLLAPPDLVSPEDGSESVVVSPMFTWEEVASANTYDFEMAYDEDFEELVESKGRFNIPTNSLRVLNLEEMTTYYWRVRSVNEFATSPWSAPFMLTTGVDNAEVPKLDFPTNGSTMLPVDITFSWLEAENADAYHIQVADNPQFDTPFTDVTDIPSTSYDVNGLMNYVTYYWRVSAINAQGETGWSDVWEFRTIALAPEDPVDLLTPIDETTGITKNVTLKWLAAARAEFYQLQVSKTEGFDDFIFDNENITDLEKQIFNIEEDTQYYWRVRCRNEAGYSPWSEVWTFRTWYWLGVEYEHNSKALTISPNPAVDILNVELNEDIVVDSWQIVDLNGNLVMSGRSFVNDINVSSLSNSAYYLLINSGQRKFAHKFMISR